MLKFVLIIAACYGLLVAVVYLMQGRMLYLANVPGRDLMATPADVDLRYTTTSSLPGRSVRRVISF